MTDEDQNYDMEEAREAIGEVTEYFEQASSYDAEDFEMEDESEIVTRAIGAIGAFSTSVENLNECTDDRLPEDYDDPEVRDRVMQAGVAWPEAKKAYDAINQISAEVSDKLQAAALRGVNFDSVAETATELSDVENTYHEARAGATASSKMLGPEGYETPVDVALEVAEDEDVVEHLEELEEEIPRTQEESRQQLQELISEVQ
jgi:hypothetical protein